MATDTGKVQRHAGVDRLFHWATAITMFVLLGTSLLPLVGIRFAWVEVHWIAGVVLTVAVVFHVLRAVIWQGLRTMLVGGRDVAEATGKVLPGKYSLAQKLMHHGFSLSLLVAVVTGVLMMVKSGTPFFERDPYLYSLKTWGVITLLHDLSALLAVFLVIVHVYFSLLPEKRMYLRSMLLGWMTREEVRRNHDVDRWPGRSGSEPQ